jgi:hypothetical protein
MPSESDASHGFEEKRAILANSRDEVLEPMTDEQCILANPLVKGFDMKDKDWCKLLFPISSVVALTREQTNSTLMTSLISCGMNHSLASSCSRKERKT